jgi:FlaA1/EpsC-like NDP-sugar epimerase
MSDWAEFLGRPHAMVDPALAESAVAGKRVLMTGAGGSIGAGLTRAVLSGRPSSIVLLDSSEHALYESLRRLESSRDYGITPAVGSCGDSRLLGWLLERHRPEIVFHAAAYKHVPLMEQNPFAAVANNALATYRLIVATREAGVSCLVMVSTDKAVNPRSIMGASKRIAELIVLSHATAQARMSAVRLGNVLGSSGSVAPVFQEQARQALPLTVTHPDATRFFMTPAEVEAALLQAAASGLSGRILVPDCGQAFRIIELARFIAGNDARIEFVGLRAGDKLHEELFGEDEQVAGEQAPGMRVVASPAPTAHVVASAITRLEEAIAEFDQAAMLRVVTDLLPSYQPTGELLSNQRSVDTECR